MTATTPTPTTLEGIMARYREIAPPLEPSAEAPVWDMSRSLLLSAQRGFSRMLSPDTPTDMTAITAMLVQFAALHMLRHLQQADPVAAERLAREIASAWDDGGGVGEWLWEHAQPLGIDTAEVDALATAEARLRAVRAAADDAERMKALDAVEGVAEGCERVLYAAAVDLARGDADAARALLWEQLDGFDGEPAVDSETGMQYLSRMRDKRKAEADAKPEPERM